MSYNRQEAIKQLLIQKGIVYFKDLENLFPQVSYMTLRRDIEKLEFKGIAIKIRGGAKLAVFDNKEAREAVYSYRALENIDIKTTLAREALKFVETGRSVFLDSGTTIMEFAKLLPDIKLSILTTGPNIAIEVSKKFNPAVTMVGGAFNADNCSVAGAQAISFIKGVNIDIAFTTPSGYSQNGGFTCGNYSECELKRAIIKKANKVIMLTAEDKLNKSLPFTFATLKDIDILITNASLDDFTLKNAAKNDVNIVKV